jgi:hypothetical protein
MHMDNCTCCPNPVVRRTVLRAYPGWVIREYADGMFDATDGLGLSPGFNSFAETVAHLREQREAFKRETEATQNLVADMERDGLL